GGSLLLGALPRLARLGHAIDAAIFGVGLAILANSRPYEGFVLGVTCFCALTWWAAKNQLIRRRVLKWPVIFPLAVVLTLTAASMCFYFWRVTGSPVRMPVNVNRDSYAIAPYFFGQKPNSQPAYRNAVLREFYLNVEYA